MFRYLCPCRWLLTCVARHFRGGAIPVILCLAGVAASAEPSLVLSSASTKPGIPVSLSLTYSSGGVSTAVSAVQWTFTYSPSDIASVAVNAGPAATAAAKSILCSGGSGTYTCILFGATNQSAISDGTLAQVQITLAASPAGSIPVQITNQIASDGQGNSVPIGATAGGISVVTTAAPSPPAPAISVPTLTGLTCAPWFLIEPAVATCTVSLSEAAPAGLKLLAVSSSPQLTVAPQIAIPTGASTVSVAITAKHESSSNRSATLTLKLGGSTISATLNLLPSLVTTNFNLVNADTATCLTAENVGRVAMAVQQRCSGSSSQTVEVSAVNSGYTFGFDKRTLFLNAQPAAGTQKLPLVSLSSQSAGLSHTWQLVPATTGTFLVMSAESHQCLGVQTNGSNEVSIQEKVCSTNASERWSLVPITAK